MLTIQLTPFPEIRTARLLLRPLRLADAPMVQVLRSDPRVMRFLDREPIASVAEAEEWVRKVEQAIVDNTGITWGMALAGQEDGLVGTVALWRMIPEHHRAEVGYGLHPDHWQQGLASEALAAVLDYGFRTLGLHSVEANVNPNNEGSIRLLEKHGFVREAYFREDYYFRGRFSDSAIYSLLTPLRQEAPATDQL